MILFLLRWARYTAAIIVWCLQLFWIRLVLADLGNMQPFQLPLHLLTRAVPVLALFFALPCAAISCWAIVLRREDV